MAQQVRTRLGCSLFFCELLYRIEILHNRLRLCLPEREPVPRDIGIGSIYGWNAYDRLALVFADGWPDFFLFFFHCSPFVLDDWFNVAGVLPQGSIFDEARLHPASFLNRCGVYSRLPLRIAFIDMLEHSGALLLIEIP